MSLEKVLEEESQLEEKFYGRPTDNQEDDTTSTVEDGDDEVVVESTPTQVSPGETTEEPDKKTRSSWKARFSSYKAATDKTISLLRKDNQHYISQIQEAREKIDSLSGKIAALMSKDEDFFNGAVTAEDIEIIGPEAVDVVKKATKTATERAVNPLIKELERLKAKELQRERAAIDDKVKTNYNYFLKDLGNRVPDYAVLDKDPKFKKYMEEFDSSTGEKRVDIFRRAEDYLDAPRIAEFFLDYKDSIPKSKRSVLEENITPDQSGGSVGSVNNSDKTTFTLQEVDKFFSDYSKGVYRNKEKEASQIEARITKAYMNGNIR